jgi:beta-lactamase regulating signal transducer with metallopeptidase domain
MSLGAWLEARLVGASLDLAVLAVLVWAAVRLLRPRPRLAALLWVLVLVKPLAGLIAGAPLTLDLRLPVPQILREASAARLEVETRELPSPAGSRVERWSSRVPVPPVALAWALGAAAVAGWALWDRLRLARLIRAAQPAPAALRTRLAEVAARLGVRSRAPRLLVTGALESPALAGTLSPVILLPAWLVESGADEQLDWALGHELMHRKMGDPWAGALRELVRILFFFHPVAWWAGRKWEEAAELACDRALVASEDDAVRYAERLYEILAAARGRRRLSLASGLFASRTQIGRRIEALLGGPLGAPARLSPRGSALFSVAAAALLLVGVEGCRPAHQLQAEIEITGPEGRYQLDADGRIEWARNYDDIRSISPGGFVTVREVQDDTTFEVDFRPLPGGEIERTWSVDGQERPFNHEARVWLARSLPRVAAVVEGPRIRPVFRPFHRIEDRLDRVWRRLHV